MIIPGWLEQDRTRIALLMAVAFVIYLPVGFTDYLYTDEAVQLWNFRPGSGYNMFTEQGRYLTDKLFQFLFGRIDRITQLRWLRLFSLFGWILCLPLWYKIIADVVTREELPARLTPLFVMALIASPTVCISVSWASCMELFIAYTLGLCSGWMLYRRLRGINYARKRLLIGSLLFGLVSLFFYQHGFGMFLFPFLLQVLGKRTHSRQILLGIAGFFLILLIYFLLFRLQLHVLSIVPSSRAELHVQPLHKLKFFLAVPLAAAFRFGFLVNEHSKTGLAVSAAIMIALVYAALRYFHRTERSAWYRGILLVGLVVLSYLPSLIVSENYASNRTQLALNFSILACTLVIMFRILKSGYGRVVLILMVLSFYVFVGGHQYLLRFRMPIVTEYLGWRSQMDQFTTGIHGIVVERPAEDYFVRHYKIIRSWDEFGVPSMHFSWVPKFYMMQLIYEKTGSRALAESVNVESYLAPGQRPAPAPDHLWLSLKGQ